MGAELRLGKFVRDESDEDEWEEGQEPDDAEQSVLVPSKVLKRHVCALGASGSGKTVFGKVVIEEAALAGIPSIVFDPQGDLASLILDGDADTITERGGDSERASEFWEKAEVRIFTPTSEKGVPLCMNPFDPPAKGVKKAERVKMLDLQAASIASIAGYDISKKAGRSAKDLIYEITLRAQDMGLKIGNAKTLSRHIAKPEKVFKKDPAEVELIITERRRMELARAVKSMSRGMTNLLLNFGAPVDIDMFRTPINEGKVPINVIYLNTLGNEDYKQHFISMVGKELYAWMLDNPSDQVQLLTYIDEVAPYIPPHPLNPPAKEIIKLLFKQGRKYGVSMMIATQNPADMDYKVMAQANTWALGRLMTKQDIGKVKNMLESTNPTGLDEILDALPTLSVGQFMLICPDVFDSTQQMQCRWLYTDHSTLDDDQVAEVVDAETRAYFADSYAVAAVAEDPEEPEEAPKENFSKMLKGELVDLAKERGLKTTGTKKEIVERLEADAAQKAEAAAAAADEEEEDDEDDVEETPKEKPSKKKDRTVLDKVISQFAIDKPDLNESMEVAQTISRARFLKNYQQTAMQLALLKLFGMIVGFTFLLTVSIMYFIGASGGTERLVPGWGLTIFGITLIATAGWVAEWVTVRRDGKGVRALVHSDSVLVQLVNWITPLVLLVAWLGFTTGFMLRGEKVGTFMIDFSLLAFSFTALVQVSEYLASNPPWMQKNFVQRSSSFLLGVEVGQYTQAAVLAVIKRLVELATLVALVVGYILIGLVNPEGDPDRYTIYDNPVARTGLLLLMSLWIALTLSGAIAQKVVSVGADHEFDEAAQVGDDD